MEAISTDEYDAGWESKWDDMKQYGPFSRHIRRILKDMVRPLDIESILDVGCGQGSLLAELKLEFPYMEPYGVDISKTGVELARKRVPDGKFWVMDIARDALNKRCDLVICSEVLEHIPDDITAIRNLKQMTGKYLVISTPQGKMREFERQVGHVRNYARGELVNKLEENGFAVISVIEWGFPFYSPLYRDFLGLIGSRGTTGEFGSLRKLLAGFLYFLFMLNSSKRGDEIFVLAQPATQ
jgi:SAM-dependent methyltransferase